jgi:glutathione synthase/RimK-type ligase-like ATP-grasp enzyme
MNENTPNKVLVLYSFATHKTGYYDLLFNRLADAAEEFGVQLYRGSLKDLVFSYANGSLKIRETMTGMDVTDFDAVYFELWYKSTEQTLALAMHLRAHGVPFLSEELANMVSMSKLSEMVRLTEAAVPYPATVSSSTKHLQRLIREDAIGLEYPFVLKEASAYGGNQNFLVDSPKQALRILRENRGGVFLAQEFLPNAHDFRVIVLGGKAVLVLKRARNTDIGHLNNTSAGGEGTLVELAQVDKALLQLAERAAEAMGRSSFAGVDILERSDTGEYVVLEVNQTPQIEIGAEIDAKMAVMLTRLSELAKEGRRND